MKKLFPLLALAAVSCLVFITSCKDDKGPPPPTPGEIRTELLAKTWVVDPAVPNSVTLDGSDLTAEFSSFTLTVTSSRNYSTSGTSSTFAVWPASGSFTFATNASGDEDVNIVIRDDGVNINIDEISETSLSLRFNFSTASASKGGRITGIDGDYIFVLKSN